jgi:hypothetical protein
MALTSSGKKPRIAIIAVLSILPFAKTKDTRQKHSILGKKVDPAPSSTSSINTSELLLLNHYQFGPETSLIFPRSSRSIN